MSLASVAAIATNLKTIIELIPTIVSLVKEAESLIEAEGAGESKLEYVMSVITIVGGELGDEILDMIKKIISATVSFFNACGWGDEEEETVAE